MDPISSGAPADGIRFADRLEAFGAALLLGAPGLLPIDWVRAERRRGAPLPHFTAAST